MTLLVTMWVAFFINGLISGFWAVFTNLFAFPVG